MKFGKSIQSQHIPGWAPYYLDYKFLKKIISSCTANRPASEAAILALGVRPADLLSQSISPAPVLSSEGHASVLREISGRPPLFAASSQDKDRGSGFQAHKAAFFFKLERELEKINAFYLQKEAELALRLETLLSKRRAAAIRGLPDTADDPTRVHVEWSAVEEGFRVLERDLGKLQQYIEINATGFRKILKKWDKRSASKTKEIYLTRQVDIQPVFNRQLISELADTVSTCLHNLTDLSSGLKFEGRAANDIFTQLIMTERTAYTGPFRDLENNLREAVVTSDIAVIKELLRYSDVLAQQNGGKSNVARILWKIIIEAPDELADLVLSSLATPFDYDFVDDINGRTCLHEAAIAGASRLVNICIQQGIQVDKIDIYGRSALHYACMNGHADICQMLLKRNVSPHSLDLDNCTPLVYATMRGNVDCVSALLDEGASMQAATPLNNLIPLSLASQSGHAAVVTLLLRHGAQSQPNTNGEYPMHLAAREGHAQICRLLVRQEGWDVPDKYHEWTPLFHAARHGRASCVEVLLEAGCRVDIADEHGRYAIHYAAWHGHHQCTDLLMKTAKPVLAETSIGHQLNLSPPLEVIKVPEPDGDCIPSLSLPPPIMPYRAYGHNYLDKVNLVQVAIGNSASRSEHCSRNHASGVRLQQRVLTSSSRDEYVLPSNSLKLVMTTGSDMNSAPYSMSLPQRDVDGVFSFQIVSLDALSLQFSIYPNFGTRTIGRAVALPSLFSSIGNSTPFVLPILDHRLQVIGEVSFEVNIIKPYHGVTLEVGGGVETYWKSTAMPVPSPAVHGPASQSLQHSAHTSPSNQSVISSAGRPLTVSSLAGEYVYAVIQVTRDLQPVVCSDWMLKGVDFDLCVSDVTLPQFETLALRLGTFLDLANSPPQNWPEAVSTSMLSLTQLLNHLPATVGICLELAFAPRGLMERDNLCCRLDMNVFVDSVLRTLAHASSTRSSDRRKIVFTSFMPDICAALNWKQPNYPVFFGLHCGEFRKDFPSLTATSLKDERDRRYSSLAAAVEFSKANNLLGIFVNADFMMPIPSLIQDVHATGLVVGVYGSDDVSGSIVPGTAGDGALVDAVLQGGVVNYIEHLLVEPI